MSDVGNGRAEKRVPAIVQAERDEANIKNSLFTKSDARGQLLESYITHARISEVTSRDDLARGAGQTKPRVFVLSAAADKRVNMHKARENPPGNFQIGRSWDLKDLTSLELVGVHGMIANMGKPYFWLFASTSDKVTFANRISTVYAQYTGKQLTKLGFDPSTGDTNPAHIAEAKAKLTELSRSKTSRSRGSPPPVVGPNHQYPMEALPPQVQELARRPSKPGGGSFTAAAAALAAHSAAQPPPMPSVPANVSANAASASSSIPTAAQAPPKTPTLHQRPYPLTPRSNQTPPNQSMPNAAQSPLIPPTSVRRQKTTVRVVDQTPIQNAPDSNGGGRRPSASSRGFDTGSVASNSSTSIPGIAHADSGMASSSSQRSQATGTSAGAAGGYTGIQAGMQAGFPAGPPAGVPAGPPSTISATGSATSLASRSAVSVGSNTRSNADLNELNEPPARSPERYRRSQAETIKAVPSEISFPEELSDRSAQRPMSAALPPQEAQIARPPQDELSPADPRAEQMQSRQSHASRASRAPSSRDEFYDVYEMPAPEEQPGGSRPRSRSISPRKREPSPLRNQFSERRRSNLPSALSEEALNGDRRPGTPPLSLSKRLSALASPSPRNSRQLSKSEINARRRSKLGHSREQSNVSLSSRNQFMDAADYEYNELDTVLSQIEWSGGMDSAAMEKKLGESLAGLGSERVSNVVSLDANLDELDKLISASLNECSKLDNALSHVGLQLASIGDEIRHIEGRGEGLQVVTMNQRLLAQELETLLGTVRLGPDLVNYLTTAGFSDVHELPRLEAALKELFGAVQAAGGSSDKTQGGMMAAREQEDVIQATAAQFDERFLAFFTSQVGKLSSESQVSNDALDRIDGYLMRNMYPLSGVVLFVKETNTKVFKKLLSAYVEATSGYYRTSIPTYFASWAKKLESQVKGRPPFAVYDEKASRTLDAATAASNTASLRAKALKSTGAGHHHAHLTADNDDFMLSLDTQKKLYELFAALVNTVSEHASAQQQVFVNLFHLSTHGASDFASFIKYEPLDERIHRANTFGEPPVVNGVDNSRSRAQETLKAVSSVFTNLDNALNQAVGAIKATLILESVALVGILELHLQQLASTDQDFSKKSFEQMRSAMVKNWTSFIDEQSRLTLNVNLSLKRRVGVIPVVTRFCTLLMVVEKAFKLIETDMDKSETRKMIDNSESHLYRSVLQMFDRSSKGTGASMASAAAPAQAGQAAQVEDKEALNARVTLIENLDQIISRLDRVDSFNVQNIRVQARARYNKELQHYISDVIHRPFGRVIEFTAMASDSKDPKKKTKASAFRKVASEFEPREMRKRVDLLRKRVEKHFGEESHDKRLVGKIWTAIGAEALALYTRFADLGKRYDAEGLVEASKQDVVNAFK